MGFGGLFSFPFLENRPFERREEGLDFYLSVLCATAGALPQTGLRCWGAAVGAGLLRESWQAEAGEC